MESDGSYYPGIESETGVVPSSGQQEHHQEDHVEPVPSNKRKRPSPDDSPCLPPLKRQRGNLSIAYLELLNRDIQDAAERMCLDDGFNAPQSQLGLSMWLPVEKQKLFEAIGRLGRHDLAGITACIQSKSLVEVQQYIHHLRDANNLRRGLDRTSALQLAEYPAAVELTPQCCHAQEEAADSFSLRQEQREAQQEEKKWGSLWDITPQVARDLDQEQQVDDSSCTNRPPFSRLLHLTRWLKLAQRLFMNSSVPEGNWNYFDELPPSMWATAFDDFYSLALSLTRRLVQTTLYVSMTRLRAQHSLNPHPRDVVRKMDVHAAISILSLSPNSRQHWMGLARRLHLHVYEELSDPSQECDLKPMSYDQVESALCTGRHGVAPSSQQTNFHDVMAQQRTSTQDNDDDDDDDDANDDDEEDENVENEEENHNDHDEHAGNDAHDTRSPSSDVDDDDIAYGVDEALQFPGAGLLDVRHARQAIKHRRAIERWQEEQAERHDAFASYQAEEDMWHTLGQKPPVAIPQVQDPGRLQKRNLDNICPLKGDWSRGFKYQGEWETLDQNNRVEYSEYSDPD